MVLAGAMFATVPFVGYNLDKADNVILGMSVLKANLGNPINNTFDNNTIFAYQKFLLENNLIPLEDAKRIIKTNESEEKVYAEKQFFDVDKEITMWQKIDEKWHRTGGRR